VASRYITKHRPAPPMKVHRHGRALSELIPLVWPGHPRPKTGTDENVDVRHAPDMTTCHSLR